MKDNKDELIQKFLDEKGLGEENMLSEMVDDADMKAYNILYDTLKQGPEQGLSYSFKSSVMRQIELEKKQADDTRFYLLFSMVFVIGIIAIVSMLFMTKDALAPIVAILDKFKGYIIVIVVAVLLSRIIDQKLIKNQG